MQVRFDCTQCGRCCHDLRLRLSVDEAIDWLRRGGEVELLCEAMPWLAPPAADNPQAVYKGARGFPAVSGGLPLRILVVLAARFEGACPHLQPDMLCGAYEARPRVCAIYPAEINPFLVVTPDRKSCPPEAWAATAPVLTRNGVTVDATIADLIAHARAADVADVDAKARLCVALGIDVAAFENEGLAVHRRPATELLVALEAAVAMTQIGDADRAWRFVTNRAATLDMLRSVGADGDLAGMHDAPGQSYIGFFPADSAA